MSKKNEKKYKKPFIPPRGRRKNVIGIYYELVLYKNKSKQLKNKPKIKT